ncbi:MAG: DUF547 domain-containing protein [Burkholderiales bacterium]
MNDSRHAGLSRRTVLASMAALAWPAAAQAVDHSHAAWSALLKKHVVVLRGGQASKLRYAGMATDRVALQRYLATLSAVGAQAFAAFSKPQQMAFLINAYNANTVELVLGRYPDLKSIKDLGGLLSSPWKEAFVPLLGGTHSLDEIEHGMLRAPGRYNDPRIHFAVNCASVGCPPLREEAFVAERLEAQLDEQAARFMADRSRNRWSVAEQRLEVSKIFDWYGDDFRAGHRGIGSLEAFFARHADALADAPADRERIRTRRAPVAFLAYDWALNDARP